MAILKNTGIFDDAYDDREVGAEADLNNLETTMNVSPIPTARIHKDHPKDHIIGDINSATQTKRMTKIYEEHVMVWILVNLPKGKKAIGTKWVYRNKKDERGIVVRNKARLVAQDWMCDKSGLCDMVYEERSNDAQEIPDEFYGGAYFLPRIASTTEGGWNLH
ncbi:putative ribonuclease H-like domain-containing protein [Tanacetum coccineum]